jgi:hypothetical protein
MFVSALLTCSTLFARLLIIHVGHIHSYFVIIRHLYIWLVGILYRIRKLGFIFDVEGPGLGFVLGRGGLASRVMQALALVLVLQLWP